MSTFLLIPGAGGLASYWHLVERRLRDAGHAAVAVDLPAGDAEAGLNAYVQRAAAAVAEVRGEVVVVAQSMGAFTAVPLCERIPARGLVLLNAMIPLPQETAGEWWEHTGAPEARRAAARAGGYAEEFDPVVHFLHDVPAEVLAAGPQSPPREAPIAFEEPCPFNRWPDVPTAVWAGREDRLFPFTFQERVSQERLALPVHPLPGGHLAALSQPAAVADALLQAG